MLATIFVAVAIAVAPQAVPAPPAGTALLVGQVVDATSGSPVAEAIVSLTMRRGPGVQPAMAPDGRVVADAEGRFFFSELPAGEFSLYAMKEGYLGAAFGQRRPGGTSQRITLTEGQRRADVTLRVWKYAVITGTVVDEAGEPAVGVAVKALPKTIVGGRTRFGDAYDLAPNTNTDDRGMFRISRVIPGTYVVLVPSTQTTLPVKALEVQDSSLRTEMFWGGVSEVTPLGQPRTQQVGEFALMTLSRVLIPPPPSPDGRLQVYPATYFPSATTPSAATPITLQSGEERDVAIALRPVRAVRVSGQLITPDGSRPPRMTVRLMGAAMDDLAATSTSGGTGNVSYAAATALTDAAGRFTLLGVPPGDYVIQQANDFFARNLREGLPAYWVSQPLTVGNTDVVDVPLRLRHALRIEGRVEFRSEKGTKPPPRPPMLILETATGEAGRAAVEITSESFSSVVMGGRYLAYPYELNGWYVHSVTLDGKDVTDRAFDLQEDVASLVITLTDRPTKVTGTVTDERGNATATAAVLLFPVDRQRWFGYGTSPRIFKSATTTENGAYTFEHVPAGDYHVIAIDPAGMDGWQEPARLEALMPSAAKLTVAASDTLKTLDLRVQAIR